MAKIALSAEFQGFSRKFLPLKNIFRTLENGHSIRHQSIHPLSAGRIKKLVRKLVANRESHDSQNRRFGIAAEVPKQGARIEWNRHRIWVFFRPTFQVKSSERFFLVDFNRFFPRSQSSLVKFSRFFPRFQSVLVSFSQF